MSLPARVALLTILCVDMASAANAQTPVFHGVLRVKPAVAKLDTSTGTATLKVRGWGLLINPQESNGIFPDREAVLIAIGDNDRFLLEAGALKPNRRGNVWRYVSPGAVERGIKMLDIKHMPDGSYRVRFTLTGVDFSRSLFELQGVCMSVAVIVGDDDGFTGISVTRKNERTRTVRIPDECTPQAWPWA
jgi:hypothetical protein